ncbi:hypothetical protein [Botrimarina sp.]|uniref:hypothetical protein n=1 Tax=Botrimarina sp. TaxID=2795802 RepID=UPI0032EB9043
MKRPCSPHRRLGCLAALALAALAGCGGATPKAQRVVGVWTGRPESAAERVVREWPRSSPDTPIDPADAEVAAAVADEPPTDLESAAGVRVQMRLGAEGDATLALADQPPLAGTWSLIPQEGRRALLDIELTAPAEAPPRSEEDGPNGDETPLPESAGDPTERRRFEIEFLQRGRGFVLREAGADRRFGRLLFTPADEGPRPTGQGAPPPVAAAPAADAPSSPIEAPP